MAARRGIAHWAAALVCGTAGAGLLAGILIVCGAGPLLLLFSILLGYGLYGGPVLWLLRNESGEDADNLLQSRAATLKAAGDALALARLGERDGTANVNHARRLSALLDQAAQSEANRRRVEVNRLLLIDPGRLYPDEFEAYVGDVFRLLGYTVELMGKTGDQGVDVLAQRGGVRLAIQAKRYQGAVGNGAVQEVYAGMAHYGCHRCIVVTSGDFSSGALALAQSTGCVLIGRDRLPAMIRGEWAF